MSQDQAYNLLFGLAFVNKFVPVNETDNGATFGYGSGQTSLTAEARNIAARIIDHIRSSKALNGTPCGNNATGWRIKNPTTCNNVPTGDDAAAYAYALGEIECILKNGGTPPSLGLTWPLVGAVPLACQGGPYHNVYSKTAGFALWNTTARTLLYMPSDPHLGQDTRTFNANLMAICNCVFGRVEDQLVQNIVWVLQLVPVLSWLGVVISWVWNFVSTVVNTFYPGYFFNDTEPAIRQNCYLNGNGTIEGPGSPSNPTGNPGGPLDHAPLARKILHGGPYVQNSNYTFKYLLDVAPCTDIYNFNNYDYAHYEWSSDNRLDRPDRRGWYGQNNPPGTGHWRPSKAEYNGIDYMVYHNLWYIHELQEGTNPNITNMSEMDVNLGGTWSSPTSLDIFENIKINNATINFNAVSEDTYWRAGKEISFPGTTPIQGQGNEVYISGNFHAYIEKYDCATDVGHFRMARFDSVEVPTPVVPETTPKSNGKKKFDNLITELPTGKNPLDEAMRQAYPGFSRELFVKPTLTEDKFRVYFTLAEDESAMLHILDLSGRIIYQNSSVTRNDSGMELDLSSYYNGLYMLKFSTTKGTEKTWKIVKETK
jgi:hypothetical protein